jgi:hypothetical protein
MQATSFVNNIFNGSESFGALSNDVFHFQYNHNKVYRQWCDALGFKPLVSDVQSAASNMPFLPISFFKTREVVTTDFVPAIFFESSGTTQTINSRHYLKDASLYTNSFMQAFEMFYGDVKDWCIIGLLPAYLERQHSSLVVMVDHLIKASHQAQSGFYLYEFDKLQQVLQELEQKQQKTLLIGVTFALLDFAEQHPMQLKHTVVMETGGMKGRKKELTRQEVHDYLQQQLNITTVHSEYGMTELLSQAYSKGNGRFVCPPWMKVCVRDEEDPLHISATGRGLLNITDLANVYSCSFIATDDVGIVYEDGSFEVWGRMDNSDMRGCSLLVV